MTPLSGCGSVSFLFGVGARGRRSLTAGGEGRDHRRLPGNDAAGASTNGILHFGNL